MKHFCIHFNFLQSGERNGTPSRRSKSEGPPLANGRCVNASENVSQEYQIKEKVFSLSLILRNAECFMFIHQNHFTITRNHTHSHAGRDTLADKKLTQVAHIIEYPRRGYHIDISYVFGHLSCLAVELKFQSNFLAYPTTIMGYKHSISLAFR